MRYVISFEHSCKYGKRFWFLNYTRGQFQNTENPNQIGFRGTDPLWGEFTGHRWIPLTKASDAKLWCFLRSAPEQMVEQTTKTLVIWDAIALIMTSL